MARNRSTAIRPLSDEQEMFLHMGDLLVGHRNNETLADLDVRLFGSHEAGGEAWRQHRPELLAEFPTAGQRPFGYWWYEHGIRWPIEQADALRALGELTADEEEHLASWAALTPELPDIGIEHGIDPTITIAPTPEDPHDIDATPEPARAQATIEASTEDEAVEAEEHEEIPVTPPRILPMRRGIDDRRPSETVGWERRHDPHEPIQLEAGGGPGTAPVPEGRGSEERADQPQVGPDEAEVPDAATGNHVIEFTPWPGQNGRPREIEGWET